MKVSIIIPYNKNRGYLDQAIMSIEKQSYKNYEIIESHSKHGVSYNLNKGIKKATGDIIRYLCDDDMLPVDSLLHTVNNFGTNDFIHSNAINFQSVELCHVVKPAVIKPTLPIMLLKNCIHGGSVAYHARIFQDGHRFDESLFTAEEYDFNLKLFSLGYHIGYVNEVTYLYRRHKLQKSVGNKDAQYQKLREHEVFKIQSRYR